MSQNLVEVIDVKEEDVFEDVDVSDFNDPLLAPDPTRKCGEVFLGHGGGFTFVCSQCLQTCPDLRSFGEHIRDVHPLTTIKSPVSDVVDDQKIPLKLEPVDKDDSNILLHEKTKESQRAVNDSIFQESGAQLKGESSTSAVTQTRNNSQITKNTKYFCYTCCRDYAVFKAYREHYRRKHPDMIEKDDSNDTDSFVPKIPEDLTCRYCLSKFDESTNYRKHIQMDHPGLKQYTCPRCPGRVFTNKSVRDYHFDTHEGNKQCQCPHCPKAFTHPKNLEAHIRMHLNIKPYACRFCDYKCTQKAPLKIHERIHTKEKPFQCDECGMSFIAQVLLTNHTRKHKNIRNYPCPYCEKAFFTSKCLVKHKRTHTKETPFSCDVCGRKFGAEGSLRTHKQLHSDEKKYECKLCRKMFAQYAGLYSHMKSHGELKIV